MSTYTNLPAPSPEQGLNRYLQEIRKFPLLEPEQEYMLAKRWVDHQDANAAHQMVTSHLRLAAKIAMGYRGYGLPIGEVVSEGNVGLMQAVKKFEPERGFRLPNASAFSCGPRERKPPGPSAATPCWAVRHVAE